MSQNRIDFNDLLKWSLSHQESYPIDPNASNTPYIPRPLSEEDHLFLLDALDNKVMDEQKRVKILLQVLRLPSDPNLLYIMDNIDQSNGSTNENDSLSGLKPLNDKKSLRTLLEMRQEDDLRKKMGLDIIGTEYIPGNVLHFEEIIKKKLILSTLSTLPSLEDEVNEVLGPNPDELTSDERIEKRKQVRINRIERVTNEVEKNLEKKIFANLKKISFPKNKNKKNDHDDDDDDDDDDDNEILKIYKKIRNEKLDTFEEIEDRTHRGDNAIGFVSFNGLPIIKQYLLSSDYELAAEAWRLLGSIVSNQAFCQQKAIEYGLVQMAIETLNMTRYIPSLLASYIYSTQATANFIPPISPHIRLLDFEKENEKNIDEKLENNENNYEKKNNGNDCEEKYTNLKPSIQPSHLSLSHKEFLILMKQYAPSDLKEEDYMTWLYQFTQFGHTYTKFIFPMLKSVLFFLVSICNNNSTAQTQFILHHGLVPLSHILQIGNYHLDQFSRENKEKDEKNIKIIPKNSSSSNKKNNLSQTSSSNSIPSIPTPILSPTGQLLIKLIDSSDSVFRQILRRTFQLMILLVDDEYKVTTSGEICSLIFKNTISYQHILYQSHLNNDDNKDINGNIKGNCIPGTSILTFTPNQSPFSQTLPSSSSSSSLIERLFLSTQSPSLDTSSSSSPSSSQTSNNTDNTQNNKTSGENTDNTQNNKTSDNNTDNTQNNKTSGNNTDNTQNNKTSGNNTDNRDEGHARGYFQDPIAPLKLENAKEIHPAFKLKSNLAGGQLNIEGEHIETQLYLSPFISLLIPIFFPYTLWTTYFNCNEWDRDIVISSERLLGFVMKNFYPLKKFSSNLTHLTNLTPNITNTTNTTTATSANKASALNNKKIDKNKNVKKIMNDGDHQDGKLPQLPIVTPVSADTAEKTVISSSSASKTSKLTPDEISKLFSQECLFLRKKIEKQGNDGKYTTLLHDFLTIQVQLTQNAQKLGQNIGDDDEKKFEKNQKIQSQNLQNLNKNAIQNVIIGGVLDYHVKQMAARNSIGPHTQQVQTKEWNAVEIKYINAIKTGLNQ